MQAMRPYSEDLRTRIVQAVRKTGCPSLPPLACSASASPLSSVMRGQPTAEQRRSRLGRAEEDHPRRTKSRGSCSKRTSRSVRPPPSPRGVASWSALRPRSSATLPSGGCSKEVWASPKKTGCGGDRTRRMAKSRLEGERLGEIGPGAVSLRRRDRSEHFPFCPACLVAPWGAGALLGAP
jgi:hypothetical protein